MGPAFRLLRRFSRDKRGTIAVTSAVIGTAMLGFAALSVDVGSFFLERRHLQGVADRAAMMAAQHTRPEQAARVVLQDHGVAHADMRLTHGHWTPDRAQPVSERFDAGGGPSNAIEIEIEKAATTYFAGMFLDSTPRIRVRAVASVRNLAAFEVGSRLAGLNHGLLNRLLSALTGTDISLSVMDYEALLAADVELLRFVDALAASASIEAADYADVLDADVRLPQIVDALAGSVAAGRGQNALRRVAASATASTATIRGSRLLDLGPLGDLGFGETSGIAAKVSALDMLRAAANVAGASRQIDLDTGLDLGPLTGLQIQLAVGEPPVGTSWIAIGEKGAEAYTAQTRLRIVAGVGPVLGIQARVPLIVHVASGYARLDSIICGDDPAKDVRVGIRARPSVLGLYLGEPRAGTSWSDFSRPPEVVPAMILKVPVIAEAVLRTRTELTNEHETPLSFTAAQIASGAVQKVATRQPLSSALRALLEEPRIDVTLLGGILDLGLGRTVEPLLKLLIPPIAGAVEPIVLAVTESLGISIGEVDVRVRGVRCNRSALVL